MPSPTYRDPFVWHELMTSDVDAALAFYQKVIGWTKQPHDPSYTMLVAKTGPIAGVMLLPEEAKAMGSPPCWLIYIGTPDVDETSRRAADLGGTVLRAPADIPEVGRFAVLADPQGAVFAAFTPKNMSMNVPRADIGGFSWHELATTDWQAALDFYQRLFGWEKTEATDMGPLGTYQMYGLDGHTLGGIYNKPASMAAPPHWLAYIKVPDAKKTAGMARANGGQVLNGPMEVPGGDWTAQCMDPQGVVFAVHSTKPAVKAAPAPKAAAKKPAAKKAAAKKRPAKKAAAKKPPKKKKAAKKRVAKKAARKVARKKKAAPRRAKKRVARTPARRRRAPKRAAARRRRARPRRKAGAKRRRR
jgi:predicted enzyme related to lactoylglutathione lyase